MNLEELSPAQSRVVTELMGWGQPRPRFDRGLAASLREWLEDGLRPVVDLLGAGLYVSKRDLGQVHTCEAHWVAQRGGDFGWNPRTATGTVVHKAIELSVFAAGDPDPLDLIDHAIATFVDDDRRTSPQPWLATASTLELAELRSRANQAVAGFQECWPRLRAAWRPRAETSVRAQLCEDRVTLQGKVDLVLGVAKGNVARALIVDLKTGRSNPGHRHDLRYYALVQTLRIGTPPFRVASYYLDSATFTAEDVTVELLETAVRRTIDGVTAMARLGRQPPADIVEPTISPGPTCTWCSLNSTCAGPAQLVSGTDLGTDGDDELEVPEPLDM